MKYEMVNTIGSVRLIPNVRAILFSLKDDLSEAKGLLFDQDARRWYLFEETRVLLSNADIPQDETNKYARILSPENEGYHNSLLSAAGVTADWKNTCQTLESSFAKCVLRRDLYGKLVLGLVTEPKSKVYLPPIIANISPEVFGEFIPEALYDLRQIPEKVKLRPWPFNSSTDISVSNGPANSLVAEGQIEFLILGWNMCLPNFGKGTRINVQKGTQGMILMDATGNGVKVDDEGVYTYDGNHWKRVTEKK
ncbi:MAG: hypothetical protein NTW14_01355 [bacterium]|nr:hypothetical protein [bacterium]